jgi:hypothetical protein
MPTDRAWTLPDDVWAVPETERADRANWNQDLCDMDGRFFVRGVLKVPFQSLDGYYGWGVWAEIAEMDFNRYLEIYSADGSQEPPVAGKLANDICHYGNTLGMPVSVQFGNATSRPAFSASLESGHRLAQEQLNGMSNEHYHEILLSMGYLGGP